MGAAAALGTALVAPSADACSVTSAFLPPSNFELVHLAPQIVVGEVIGGANLGVEVQVIEVVRGSALPTGNTFTVEGTVTTYAGPSPVGDFSRARPGAMMGGCVAYDYRVGGRFLFFLDKTASGWRTLSTPFARVNEELTTPQDPWLTAVRAYASIASKNDPVVERALLESLRAASARTPAPSADASIAEDIARHFVTPSNEKTFAELKALFDAASSPPAQARVLTAIGNRGDRAAASLMAQILKQAQADPGGSRALLGPLASYYEKQPDPLRLKDLGELYLQLGPKEKSSRWPLMWTLIHAATKEHTALMTRALTTADDEEAARIAGWFVRFSSPEARALVDKRLGADFENKSALAFAAAGMGARPPLDWALLTLKAPVTPSRWIAVYIVARSPLPAADRAAGEIIALGGHDRLSLIQAYSEAHHANVRKRLDELAVRPDLDADDRRWLGRTVADQAQRP